MRWFGWFRPARREPKHVRLQVLHEASATGDFAVEGFQLRETRDWIVLEQAVVIEADGNRKHLRGPVHVPRGRLLLRETLVAISLPELPMVGA